MLSIEESRKHLGSLSAKLTDKEVENLRNSLYQTIGNILDEEFEKKPEL